MSYKSASRFQHFRIKDFFKISVLFFFLAVCFLIKSENSYSQEEERFMLSGKVLSVFRDKPIDYAKIIVFEAQQKTYSKKDGSYSIQVPRAGRYTIKITSPGLKALQLSLVITKDTKKDFVLRTARIRGEALTITRKRDIQKVSRHTLSVAELKETPATKLYKSKEKATNPAFAGFLENKFEYGGLKVVPGIRVEFTNNIFNISD